MCATNYINDIRKMCRSNYGSILLQLMEYCNKNSLAEVENDEARDFLYDVETGKINERHFRVELKELKYGRNY